MESSRAGSTIGNFVRRRIVIDPAIQWNCALTIALIVFLCSSVLGFGVFGQLHQQARLRLMSPGETGNSVTILLLSFAVGSAAVTAGGVGFWSLWMTRRICGPAFVMERYLKELKSGRIPKTRSLRKKDEFKQLYQALNEAFDALRFRANSNLALVCDVLESIRASGASGDGSAMKQSMSAIAPKLEALRAELVASIQGNEDDSAANKEHAAIPQSVSQRAV